jgi:cellulose synthase/poly-beta-1,6-N-acetylglucosamine synthase-like glycosyltransferase
VVFLAAAFWLCLVMLAYVYVGYPALTLIAARFFGRKVRKSGITPTVTVIVAAYNEEASIRAKLGNVLGLDYPHALLNVIVASDGSSDRTDELVRDFPSSKVTLLRVEGRQGKTACQNRAVEMASGEIVVFTDATTRIASDAIRAMVECFADEEVGCVAASLVYEGKGKGLTGQGGADYWNYEIALRRAEAALGSLVGVSGCLYAVRKSVYRPIAPELISDFVIAMRVREAGLRAVIEPAATCFEETLARPRDELAMRVRVAIRSISALVRERHMLNPLRAGVFAWQLWSHKALRYASPFFWLAALVTNIALAPQGWIYQLFLAVQIVVLVAGVLGFMLQRWKGSVGVLGKPYYFLLTNIASFLAAFRYLRGEQVIVWNPLR